MENAVHSELLCTLVLDETLLLSVALSCIHSCTSFVMMLSSGASTKTYVATVSHIRARNS